MADVFECVGRHGDEAALAFERWSNGETADTRKPGPQTAAQLLPLVRKAYVLMKNDEDVHLDLTAKALANMLNLRAEQEPERFTVYEGRTKTYGVVPVLNYHASKTLPSNQCLTDRRALKKLKDRVAALEAERRDLIPKSEADELRVILGAHEAEIVRLKKKVRESNEKYGDGLRDRNEDVYGSQEKHDQTFKTLVTDALASAPTSSRRNMPLHGARRPQGDLQAEQGRQANGIDGDPQGPPAGPPRRRLESAAARPRLHHGRIRGAVEH